MQVEFDVIGNFTFKYIIHIRKRLMLCQVLLWETEFERGGLDSSPEYQTGSSNFKWNYWPKFVRRNYFPPSEMFSDYCSDELQHGKSFLKELNGALKNRLIFF